MSKAACTHSAYCSSISRETIRCVANSPPLTSLAQRRLCPFSITGSRQSRHAASRTKTGCVVAFIDIEPGLEDEKRRLRRRALIWEADGSLTPATATPHLCTNPLTWDTGPERADPAKHIGAASATGLRLGETPPPIPQLLGAACVNGILAVDRPKRQFLRRSRWFGGKWRTKDFNLFYHDLAANGALRIEQTAAALQTLEDDFASTRPPVDIEAQPTDKRPQ